MRQLLIILFSITSSSLLAQTKEIAFKSHSGNMENFDVALHNELFGSDNSNFGLPSPKEVKTYKLDSVIYVSDTVSVLVTKEYRRQYNQSKDSAKFWGVAKDTVYKDPLFTRKHSLDSIKSALQKTGYYINPVRKVVFIGYDNQKSKNKQYNIIPFAVRDDGNDNSPFDMELALMLGTILLLSLLGGWLSWKFFQPRFQ